MTNNPLHDILDKLPYTNCVLDSQLYDELRDILIKATNNEVSDSYIMLVLLELHKAGLVELSYIDPIDTIGRINFIKKVLNGK